jgi:hypothetical protein
MGDKMLDSTGSKLAVIFVICFVVVLIGVGIRTDIFSIQNKDKSLNIYSIGDVTTNPQKYIGQKITIPGYFLQGDLPHGEGYITSGLVQQPIIEGSLDNVDWIILNVSGINVAFNESAIYDFTGTVVSQGTYPTTSIILSVEIVELA